MRGGENSFLRHHLIFPTRHNSLAAVLDCNGESQQYSAKSSSSRLLVANVGYSHTVISNKLHPAKSWVSNWINHSKVDDLLVDKPRSERPKVLSSVAWKLIKKAKYRHDMVCVD